MKPDHPHYSRATLRPLEVRFALPSLFVTLLTIFSGIIAGLAVTYLSVTGTPPAGLVQLGPWQFSPRAGSPDVDPYTRAAMVVRGDLPLGIGEGITMIADKDSSGRPLASRCVYRVGGSVPSARFWTLGAFAPNGRRIDALGARHAFSSAEILRGQDDEVSLTLSRQVRPGNWLPLGADDAFVLVLRLYDTPLSAGATALQPADVPVITQMECAS